MFRNKEEYLNSLRKELKGCDKALIQDAISDAEEHISREIEDLQKSKPQISHLEALQAAIEKYGDIAEISAEYRKIESEYEAFFKSPVRNHKSWLNKFFMIVADPAAWTAALYMFLSLLTGIIYSTWAICGLSISLPMLIFIIGIPLAGFFLLSVRGIALLEGRLVELLLGTRMPRKPIFFKKGSSWWQKFKDLVAAGITWKGIIYMLLQLPLGIIYFTATVCFMSVSLGLIAAPILRFIFLLPMEISGVEGFNKDMLVILMPLAGILILLIGLHLAKLTGKLHGIYSKFMLVN